MRLCLDVRKVTSVTVIGAYPLPLIDRILGGLPKAEYITILELKDAFWQIALVENSKEKAAFTLPGHPLYQFVTCSLGYTTQPELYAD